jgi:hypothetical protein
VICGYAGGFLTVLYVSTYTKAIEDEQKRKKRAKKIQEQNQDEDARQVLEMLEKEPEEFQPKFLAKQ